MHWTWGYPMFRLSHIPMTVVKDCQGVFVCFKIYRPRVRHLHCFGASGNPVSEHFQPFWPGTLRQPEMFLVGNGLVHMDQEKVKHKVPFKPSLHQDMVVLSCYVCRWCPLWKTKTTAIYETLGFNAVHKNIHIYKYTVYIYIHMIIYIYVYLVIFDMCLYIYIYTYISSVRCFLKMRKPHFTPAGLKKESSP